MKVVVIIAQVLLGLVFVVFGSNAFLNFIHGPMPTGLAGQFVGALFQSHYLYLIGGVQVVGGLLVLTNKFVPLGVTFLGPLIVNILAYHLFFDHNGAAIAAVVAILWAFLLWRYRANFAGLFEARGA